MAKKVIGNLKLRIPAGRATAGPPVGSTLGQWGLNMMDFINPFNEATKGDMGKDVIVHIKVYEDRTFDWKSLGQPVDEKADGLVALERRFVAVGGQGGGVVAGVVFGRGAGRDGGRGHEPVSSGWDQGWE